MLGLRFSIFGGLFACLVSAWPSHAAARGCTDECAAICREVRGSSAWAQCAAAVARSCHVHPTIRRCRARAAIWERTFGNNPAWVPYTVFVTSDTYDGDLGGLKGADEKCNDLASEVGLEGFYKAWLSDGVDSPATRFTRATVPYVLVDGTRVADDWEDLTSGALRHEIDLDEDGQVRESVVWTGTVTNGTTDSRHCERWSTAAGGLGLIGRSDRSTGNWTDVGPAACSRSSPDIRLYCFEH